MTAQHVKTQNTATQRPQDQSIAMPPRRTGPSHRAKPRHALTMCTARVYTALIYTALTLCMAPAGFTGTASAAEQTQPAVVKKERSQKPQPTVDLRLLEQQISSLLQQHLFNPHLLTLPATRQHLQQQQQLAAQSADLNAFVQGFNQLWRSGPWSHVQLAPRRIPAAQMAQFVDNMEIGPDAVQLNWQGTVPVLAVNTMMGKDTISRISQAFEQLQQQGARQLIIDVRRNKGGAFAVKPLVQHLLSQPVEAGVFVTRQWYQQYPDQTPDLATIAAATPWQQLDLQSFWQALVTQPLVRIRFTPEQPVFAGQVWLLTSHKTASAAEMAVAALQHAGRVTVIGEQTAGEMLSQAMFDVAGDLQLSLPIAGYIADQYGPIEGIGLKPDITVPAQQALQQALTLAQAAQAPAKNTAGR